MRGLTAILGAGLLAGAVLLQASPVSAQQVRQLLNGLRAEHGLGALTPSPRLEEAALAHALDMSGRGFFGHDGSDGSDVGQRAVRAGYGWCVISENIARGQGSVTDVLGAWANSAPHRRNMLLEEISDYGLARAPGDIWVLVMGRDGC